jgi:hypothetical protein|tara:strand:+ start:173 stop:421 length:249 start_codon:yes stop_codon:yes gene_type:complete
MAYKLLGEQVVNPVDDEMSGTTLVYVYVTAEVLLTLKKSVADGGAVVGTMTIPANSTVSVVKYSDYTVTCPNSFCTPVANHW